jgi:hypothetical protein
MTVDFKVESNQYRNALVIEVWVNGRFRATISPTEDGIRIISRYFSAITYDPGVPPAVPSMMEFAFTDSDKPTELAAVVKGLDC